MKKLLIETLLAKIPQDPERIAYSKGEAAAMIGYTPNGLHPYIASGELKSVKIGKKKRLITRAALLDFLDRKAAENATSNISTEANEHSPPKHDGTNGDAGLAAPSEGDEGWTC